MKATNISGAKVAGLLIAFVASAAYTLSAFTMAMRTSNGAIGAGFFPRIIGVLLLITLALAIAQAILKGEVTRGPRRTSDLVTIAIFFGATAVFAVLFIMVSWLIASILYMFGILSWLNRGRHLQNALVSAGVPLALFFLLDVWLHAQFPQ